MKKNNSLFRIYKYIKCNDKKFQIIFMLFTVTEIIFSLISVIMPKVMVEALYFEQDLAFNFMILLIFFLLSMCLLGWIKTIMLNKSNAKITRIKNHYTKILYEKILNIKYQYIEDIDFLEENNSTFAVVEDYNKGIEGICHIIFRLPANSILCIAYAAILGSLSPIVIIIIIIDWFLKLKINKIFSEKMYSKKREIGKVKRRMNYYYKISHDFNFGKDIRIFKIPKLILNDYSNEISKYINTLKKLYRVQLKLENINIILGILCDFIIIGLLIYNVFLGAVSISYFIMYITVIGMFKEYLRTTNEDVSTLLCELPYIDDFFEFIDENSSDKAGELIPILSNEKIDIKFENVCFKYPKTKEAILNKINFEIKNGEKIAIVGANGAGKSTIVKLLMRFYSLSEGKISINGMDINEFDLDYLYSLYSVIFQDICIYPFTIQENIIGHEKECDIRKLKKCLKDVDFLDKIKRLPEGIQSKLLRNFYSDGIDLSGGEKQKLAIARALYKDAPISIFDEPTSALDAITEETLYKKIYYLLKDKTVIFISHRLTSIHFCDKIIFLKEGLLKESGTFNELMELKGDFYKMYKKQGKYYEE